MVLIWTIYTLNQQVYAVANIQKFDRMKWWTETYFIVEILHLVPHLQTNVRRRDVNTNISYLHNFTVLNIHLFFFCTTDVWRSYVLEKYQEIYLNNKVFTSLTREQETETLLRILRLFHESLRVLHAYVYYTRFFHFWRHYCYFVYATN